MKNDILLDCLGIWFGISCALWHVVEWVGQDKETNEEHDKNYFEKGFPLGKGLRWLGQN